MANKEKRFCLNCEFSEFENSKCNACNKDIICLCENSDKHGEIVEYDDSCEFWQGV